MNKRGQLQLSFGMIFSIIIIIAVIAIAAYVIVHFMKLKQCTDIGQFYNDLDTSVNNAYSSSGITSTTFTGILPGGVTSVCFKGNSTVVDSKYKTQYDYLSSYLRANRKNNLFLYPATKACDSALANHNLQHIQVDKFFCVDVESGKVQMKISKDIGEDLVRISR